MIFQHKSQFVRECMPTEAKKRRSCNQLQIKKKNRCLLGRLKKQVTDKKTWVSNRKIEKTNGRIKRGKKVSTGKIEKNQ